MHLFQFASLALYLPTAPTARLPLLRTRAVQASAFGQQSCRHPDGSGEFGTHPGPPSLVGDRDACGVGFLADQKGRRRHDIMARALHALGCMEHRGGCGGDSISGDGAGVLTAVPWELFEPELKGKPSESCGVAMVFLSQVPAEADTVKQVRKSICASPTPSPTAVAHLKPVAARAVLCGPGGTERARGARLAARPAAQGGARAHGAGRTA